MKVASPIPGGNYTFVEENLWANYIEGEATQRLKEKEIVRLQVLSRKKSALRTFGCKIEAKICTL